MSAQSTNLSSRPEERFLVATTKSEQNFCATEGENWHQVLPGLYLGDAISAADLAFLKNEGITHVLNCAYVSKISCEFSGVEYLNLSLKDEMDQPLQPYFPQAVDFIKRGSKTGRILVHCEKGISRSASMVMAYLIAEKGMRVNEAFQYLQKLSMRVDPIPFFRKELLDFWLANQIKRSEMSDEGPIDPKKAFSSAKWIEWAEYKSLRSKGHSDEGETEDGHWGSCGAGVMIYAIENSQLFFLLFKRAETVSEPGQWSVPGGAVKIENNTDDFNEQMLRNALDELREESGVLPMGKLCTEPTSFKEKSFSYHTFVLELAYAKEYYTPQLNWENVDYKWVTAKEALNDSLVHRGVKYVLRELQKKTPH